jgi:hypothetical protein
MGLNIRTLTLRLLPRYSCQPPDLNYDQREEVQHAAIH